MHSVLVPVLAVLAVHLELGEAPLDLVDRRSGSVMRLDLVERSVQALALVV